MLTLGVDRRGEHVHIVRANGHPIHGRIERTFQGDEGDVTCKVCLRRWSLCAAVDEVAPVMDNARLAWKSAPEFGLAAGDAEHLWSLVLRLRDELVSS